MPIKIAINGFGRIGRMALKQIINDSDCEIAAINDLTSPKMLAHLLKYDSIQGRFNRQVDFSENTILLGDRQIPVFAEKNPKDLPWGKLGIDIVLECTGLFTSKTGSMAHLEAGAKKVVISAPAGADIPTIVFGVNESFLNTEHLIISSGSCTTNCLALAAKELNRLAPIKKGFMTTIHAYTNDQNTLDSPHHKGDLRRGRTAANNIVPTGTGAAKAIGLVIPELAGKLDGVSQRVPVACGSLVELVAVVEGTVSKEDINKAMKKAASDSLGYTEDEIVSSDIIGILYGSLFDATQTKTTALLSDTLVKIAAWYDNESSHTAQMLRTTKYFAALK